MNYLIDSLPNELKYYLLDRLEYPWQLMFYSFLMNYDVFINKSNLENFHNRTFIRSLNDKETYDVIRFDKSEVLINILSMNPKCFYLQSFIILRENILLIASKLGSNNIIKFCLESQKIEVSEEVKSKCCYLAVKKGNFKCLKLLAEYNFPWKSDIFIACAKSNNIELFQRMMKTNLDISESIISDGIDIESINLHDKFMTNTLHIKKNIDKIINSLCINCNTEFLDYIKNLFGGINYKHLIHCIHRKNNLEGMIKVIKWGMDNLCRMSIEYCNKAAEIGNLDLLKWLRSKGFPWDDSILKNAYLSGNLDVIEYIQRHKEFHINFDLLEIATKSGNYELIKDLLNKGNIISNYSICHAIDNNNFEIFKYLIDNLKIPLQPHENAIVFKLLNRQDENFMLYMLSKGHYIERGDSFFELCRENFVQYGKLNTIKILDELFGVGSSLKYTIYKDNYEIFLWYIDKYNNILEGDIIKILENNNEKLLKWIITKGIDRQLLKECILQSKMLKYLDYVKDLITDNDRVMMENKELNYVKFGSLLNNLKNITGEDILRILHK